MELELEQHIFAFNSKNEIKHISEVESGRKGYYCIGCSKEMQAKKGQKKVHHFAHDPKDAALKGKCTFSNESSRHYVAKRILEEIKQIKVPPIYKFPPPNEVGMPNKIKEACIITAKSVKSELSFYENKNGDICWGKKDDFGEDLGSFLLIKPDIAFFDSNNRPILLIEIVVTHKIDAEKMSKIKRLGIDMVQVTIPKGSQEEIKESFYSSSKTEWVYNYEQETTTYIPVPEGNREGILHITDFQRELLRAVETYECRKAQINNLIRGIRKCLESEQYGGVVHSIRKELYRVEENTARNNDKLRGIQNEHRERIAGKYQDETRHLDIEENKIDVEERGLDDEERTLEQLYRKLEERYFAKDDELRVEEEELWRNSENYQERIGKIRNEQESISRNEQRITAQFAEYSRKEDEGIDGIRTRRGNLSEKYANIEAELRREFAEKERTLGEEFERLRIESTDTVKNRDFRGNSRLSSTIKRILNAREHIHVIKERIIDRGRMREAKESIDNKHYKNWV